MDFSKFWWTTPDGDGPLPPVDSIPNSLRFPNDGTVSAYLQNTELNFRGDQTYTLSYWLKKATGQNPNAMNIDVFNNDTSASGTPGPAVHHTASGGLSMYSGSAFARGYPGNPTFRDQSGWYHFVHSRDANGWQTWVNGVDLGIVEISDLDGAGGTNIMNPWGGGQAQYGAYLADYYCIDGQYLQPTAFGRYNEDGVWVPREVDFTPAQMRYTDFLTSPPPGWQSSQPPSMAFDGNPATYAITETSGSWIFAPSTPIPVTSTIEVFQFNTAGEVSWNGTTFTPNGGSVTFNGPGEISADYPITANTEGVVQSSFLNKILVDGVELIDPYLYSSEVTLVGQGAEGGFASPPYLMFDGNTSTTCDAAASNQSIKWVPKEPITFYKKLEAWTPAPANTNIIYVYNEGETVHNLNNVSNDWTTVLEGEWTFDDMRIYGAGQGARWAAVRIDGQIYIDGANPAYGANGWHLTFEDPSDLGKDYSGNANDFQAVGFSTQPAANWSSQCYNGNINNTTPTQAQIDAAVASTDQTNITAQGPNAGFDGTTNYALTASPGCLVLRPNNPIENVTQIRCEQYAGQRNVLNGVDLGNTSTSASTELIYDGPPITLESWIAYSVSGSGNNGGWYRLTLTINGVDTVLINSLGSGYDLMDDSPTQNYATLNPLNTVSGSDNGIHAANLQNQDTDGNQASTWTGTISMSEGLYYFEVTRIEDDSGLTYGIVPDDLLITEGNVGLAQGVWINKQGDLSNVNTVTSSYLPPINEGDTVCVAFNATTGDIWFGRNGTFPGDPAGKTNPGGTLDMTTGWVTYVRCVGNTGLERAAINCGQQPFLYTPPTGFKALQTQNLPNNPIGDGREHFQVLTGSGPITTITDATLVSSGNYTVTRWMGSTGSGTPATDGYTSNLSEKDPSAPSYSIFDNPASAINNSLVNFNGIGTGNAGGSGTMHSTRFVFDPPLTGPVVFQCSVGTGANNNSMVINGEAQNTSAMTASTPPYQTFNSDITDIVIFGASATYNTWFTIKSVNGVETGGFIDNVIELTVDDADGFNVGDYITNGSGKPGTITSVDGNVLTIESPYWEDGWVAGGSIGEDLGILEYAQDTFPNGVWWLKDRINNNNHQLIDSVRGGNFVLQPNTAASETSYVAPTGDAVAWCWKAGDTTVTDNTGSIESQVTVNHEAGFSIVQWVGSGGFDSIGHGLGERPGLVITRTRQGDHWIVGVDGVTTLSGGGSPDQWLNKDSFVGTNWSNGLILNSENAATNYVASSGINISGNNMMAYVWAPRPGYSAFGTYTGTGNSNGPCITLGFAPAFVLIKRVDSNYGGEWSLYDRARSPFNPVTNPIVVNTDDPEYTVDGVDILSNGFKVRAGDNTWVNITNAEYIYIAFAQNPSGGSNISPANAQ